MSDFTVGDTIYHKFTTRAFATGIPTVLAGTPVVSIYEDDSVTQITAGITLSVDFDSVVGLNHLTVVATGANGYEIDKFYQAVITTGTVGGVSVVGETVWTFSLGASASAQDLANGTDGLGAIKADTANILTDTNEIQGDWTNSGRLDLIIDNILTDTGTTIPATITTLQSDTDDIQIRLPAALIGGRMDSDIEAINNDTTAADNIAKSALGIVTGAAVGTPTTTVIDTDLTEATTDHFKGRILTFTTGAVLGQSTDITGYNGATKELTVTALTNAPAAGDLFTIN